MYDGKFVNGKYEGVGSLFDADGAPIYKGFFRSGGVYAEGFMNLSLVKLQETLGVADPPPPAETIPPVEETPPVTDTPVEGSIDGEQVGDNGGTGTTSTGTPTATDAPSDSSGTPAEETAPENEVQALSAGSNNAVTDAASTESDVATGLIDGLEEEILPMSLTFSSAQLSFVLEVDADNPEAYYVRKLTTWNSIVMEQTYQRLLDAKAVSSKEKLPNGRTSIMFKSGNAFLTFLLNKDKPVRLEISYYNPEDAE